MADNETIADVIAWLRKPIEGENAYLTLWRDEIADRLEAAHKRELARVDAVIDEAVHGYPPEDINDKRELGDCAKLRKALSMIVDACASFHEFIENGLDGHYEAIPRYDSAVDDFLRRVNTAKAALAAPPRNCDIVPIEAREAADMFHRERPCHGYCYETHDWLLAPSAEKEGGRDGNE